MIPVIVPSFAQELGRVDPSWQQPEFNKNVDLKMQFRGQGNLDGTATDYLHVSTKQSDLLPALTEVELLAAQTNILPAVVAMDGMVRSLRGYNQDEITEQEVKYRVGLGRSVGAISELVSFWLAETSFTGVLGGSAHFDGQPDRPTDADTVLLTTQGKPTLIFEGPVVGWSSRGLSPATAARVANNLSRWLAPKTIAHPNDMAVLINDTTLHRQSWQRHNTASPAAFLSVKITRPN